MSSVRASIHFDEYDEVESDILHVEGLHDTREVVVVRVGEISLHFRPEHVDLLRSLETCTAEARRDLEAIVVALEKASRCPSEPHDADGTVAA